MFDEVYLEAGRVTISAGPGGSFVLNIPDDQELGFQSPRQRHIRPEDRLSIAFADEDPLVAPVEARTLIDTEARIRWEPTLSPLARELPPECDWVRLVHVQAGSDAGRLAKEWIKTDMRGETLRDAIPEHIVRSVVVKHANLDLAHAMTARVAVTQDRLHRKVLDARYEADSAWGPIGFAFPILLPRVAELSWSDVAALRAHAAMRDLRSVLRDVELQALDEGTAGDIEEATRHAFEAYRAKALKRFESWQSLAVQGVGSLAIGGTAGLVTAGFAGPIGVASSAVFGTAVDAGRQVVSIRRRRKRSWLAAYQAVVEAT